MAVLDYDGTFPIGIIACNEVPKHQSKFQACNEACKREFINPLIHFDVLFPCLDKLPAEFTWVIHVHLFLGYL